MSLQNRPEVGALDGAWPPQRAGHVGRRVHGLAGDPVAIGVHPVRLAVRVPVVDRRAGRSSPAPSCRGRTGRPGWPRTSPGAVVAPGPARSWSAGPWSVLRGRRGRRRRRRDGRRGGHRGRGVAGLGAAVVVTRARAEHERQHPHEDDHDGDQATDQPTLCRARRHSAAAVAARSSPTSGIAQAPVTHGTAGVNRVTDRKQRSACRGRIRLRCRRRRQRGGAATGAQGAGRRTPAAPARPASAIRTRRGDRRPHPLGRAGHVDVADAEVDERVDHRVLHRRGGADRPRLADALGAERVERRGRLGVRRLERRHLGRASAWRTRRGSTVSGLPSSS